MSLAAAAFQIAAVKALDGNINAKVFDSNVDPQSLGDEPLPVVIVYTAKGQRSVEARDLWLSDHCVDFVIDIGVARKVETSVPNTSVTVEFSDTDSGQDLMLHTLQYEIERILLGDNGTWAELWRQLFFMPSKDDPFVWDRGQSSDKGVRLAILRSIYKVNLSNEPVPGAPLPAMWNSIFTAMEADAELAQIGTYWRAMVTTPTLPAWRQVQTQLGLTLEGIGPGTGIAPLFDTTTDDAPISTQITVLDEDQGVLTKTVSPDQETFTPTGGAATILKDTSPTAPVDPIPLPEVLKQNDPIKDANK